MIVLQCADWIGIIVWVSFIVNPSPNIFNMWWLVLSVSHKGRLGEIDYTIIIPNIPFISVDYLLHHYATRVGLLCCLVKHL